ncbi:hypothetical protein WME91_52940 [Sorangium sp. So ce269]
MAEVLADLLERPATAPPAGDERAGAAVAEVVPADRAGDAGGGEVLRADADHDVRGVGVKVAVGELEVELLAMAEADEEGEEMIWRSASGMVVLVRLQVGPRIDGGVAGAVLRYLLDTLLRAATGFVVTCCGTARSAAN